MLTVKNLTINDQKDNVVLIDKLSFNVNPGDKIAVIGEEGTGKSTLLKYLVDPTLCPYAKATGHVTVRGKIGYLEQDIKTKWQGVSIHDFFLLDHPDDTVDISQYESLSLLSKVLNQVKLDENSLDMQKKIGMFSGGEVIKLGLAKLLLQEPDVLLLDEPTNDLDFETILFLESFILAQETPLLFISHDERLLENTANQIIHLMRIHKKQAAITHTEVMGYTDYKRYRLKQDQHQQKVVNQKRRQHQEKLTRFRQIYQQVKHQQDQAVRNPSVARLLAKKMKHLKSQEHRYNQEEANIQDLPDLPEPIELTFTNAVKVPSKKLILDLSLDALSIENRILSKNIRLLLKGPVKIAITGKNGCGKTTLLKTIYQTLNKSSDLRIGYMPQDYDALEEDQSVLAFLNAETDQSKQAHVRKMLGALGFERSEMTVKTHGLSGGQKTKLYLLKMVIENKQVLLLDEPTRNLSPLSAPHIYDMLNGYGGALICITHDRSFIEAVFDDIYILDDTGLNKH